MALFKKKCQYCKRKINEGKEIFKWVKDPVFVGTKEKAFCCEEHADAYVEESKKSNCGKSCCG